ncbi:hypothetical protein TNCV_2136881 [Trichonephila clavipes]|nr:hypothetical protein TNCV_2136881 [Trichonephila clavipes]
MCGINISNILCNCTNDTGVEQSNRHPLKKESSFDHPKRKAVTCQNRVPHNGVEREAKRDYPHLSKVKRGVVIGAHLAGASVSRTAKLVGLARINVSRVMTAYTNLGHEFIERTPAETFHVYCLVPIVKRVRGSVRVWGAISSQGLGPLVVLTEKVTSNHYLSILVNHLPPKLQSLSGRKACVPR